MFSVSQTYFLFFPDFIFCKALNMNSFQANIYIYISIVNTNYFSGFSGGIHRLHRVYKWYKWFKIYKWYGFHSL